MKLGIFLRTLVFAFLLLGTAASPAWAQTAPAQTIWRLLDYIAVGYAVGEASSTCTRGEILND